jgi:hypothetical protein
MGFPARISSESPKSPQDQPATGRHKPQVLNCLRKRYEYKLIKPTTLDLAHQVVQHFHRTPMHRDNKLEKKSGDM